MSESFVGFVGTPLLCFANYFCISVQKYSGGIPTKPTKLFDKTSLCIGISGNKNFSLQKTPYTICF